MAHSRISLDTFEEHFGSLTELSSAAIGGEVKSVSDDFFASVHNLLLVEPAFSMKGQFGPNGALYSGWESRRHNPDYDWAIIKLGTAGTVVGLDIDSSHFNGNEGPEASVYALYGSPNESPTVDDPRWTEVLPVVPLGPNSRHLFKIPETAKVNFVKLNMIPDGGIARFKVYGDVVPVHPENPTERFDLAHVFAGGKVEFFSDQHFGVGSNLILPGRGKDMGDGWETKRSRAAGHKDWVIIKLGVPGYLQQIEIDTAHFKGNFPAGIEIHGTNVTTDINWAHGRGEDQEWTAILPKVTLGPHRQHYFVLENVQGAIYSHIRATIYPDGGIKRIRVVGSQVDALTVGGGAEKSTGVPNVVSSGDQAGSIINVPVLPLTPEAFAPFGDVVQGYGDHAAVPKGTKITPANQGSASKFHKLSLLASSYSVESRATTGLSVYRCKPATLRDDGALDLTVLERHSYTNQTFVPMGKGAGEGLVDPANGYLVVVAKNGDDDKPDMGTIRAFIASTAQGIVYKQGIWHQPMTVLHRALDLTCVETQIGDGSKADCEILELGQVHGGTTWRLAVPRV